MVYYDVPFNMVWFFKPCRISSEENWICSNADIPWREYNPFDFYGKDRQKNLYLEFSALKTTEEIINFVSRFGPLGLDDHLWEQLQIAENEYRTSRQKKPIAAYHNERYEEPREEQYERIEQVEREIQIMRAIMELFQAMSERNLELLILSINSLLTLNDNLKRFTGRQSEARIDFGGDDPIDAHIEEGYRLIASVIDQKIRDVRPRITCNWYKPTEFKREWEIPNLLSAMYIMLYTDLIEGKRVKKCKNETCGQYFQLFGDDERKIYCDARCAGQQSQREYRRRKKVNGLSTEIKE